MEGASFCMKMQGKRAKDALLSGVYTLENHAEIVFSAVVPNVEVMMLKLSFIDIDCWQGN